MKSGVQQPCCALTKQERGLTLVELLVALLVLSLMAVMSWRGLDGMIRAQSHSEDHSQETLALQTALAQWQADWDAVADTGLVNAVDFDGQVLRLTRRDRAIPPPSGTGLTPDNALPPSDLKPQTEVGEVGEVEMGATWRVVAWRLGEIQGQRQWLRWQSPALSQQDALLQAWDEAQNWGRGRSGSPRVGEVQLLPAASWQVLYYRSDAWVNPLSDGRSTHPMGAKATTNSSSLAKTSNSPNTVLQPIPDAVRLILDLQQAPPLQGRIQLDWVNPRYTPSRS